MSLESTTCSSCGATLPDGAVFCTRCGTQVRVPDTTAREAPAGAPAAGDTVLERPRTERPQAGGPQASGRDAAEPPAAGPDWVVPPPPTSTAASGGAAHGRLPRWALAAVVVAVVAVAAAIAVIVILGADGESDGGEDKAGGVAVASPSASPSPSVSRSPTVSASPTASPSPQPTLSAGVETEAEELTRFLAQVRPIVAKWTKLDKKLSHALWKEAHQRRDATWPPAGRKIQALTDGFNPITSALWRVDTPVFMQPAIRDLLSCARLEHRAYDKAAAMLISGDWKNKTWQKMSGAANKAWRAYLTKRDREKERLGLAGE